MDPETGQRNLKGRQLRGRALGRERSRNVQGKPLMPNPSPVFALFYEPTSGLDFPWCEEVTEEGSTSSMQLGAEGVGLGFSMWVYWTDLEKAVQQLLGYTARVYSPTVANPNRYILNRHIPWQHPYFNQLYVKAITGVKGVQNAGTNIDFANVPFVAGAEIADFADIPFTITEGGVGPGFLPNVGPYSCYTYALLTLSFWRPPYFVRTDEDILDGDQNPQEWMRYVDKHWELGTEMLSKEGSTFVFTKGQGVDGRYFQGSVGQAVCKMTLKKTWYEVPEAALFNMVQSVPNGLPVAMTYTQTATTNPVSGYIYPAGSPFPGCVNTPNDANAGVYALTITTTANSATATSASTAGMSVGDVVNASSGPGIPFATTVVSVGVGTFTMSNPAANNFTGAVNFITDANPNNRFFGCLMGTLKYVGVHFEPKPLQLPPYLMQIPTFAGNEPISQQQYNVTFEFEFFDPPRVSAGAVGTVIYVQVTNGGTGYTTPPTVTFTPVGMDPGTGAQAVANVSGGKVTSIVIVNPGSGYLVAPTVSFSAGGAAATAVILTAVPSSTYRGHNLMPFSGTAFWYMCQSQQGPVTTPLQWARFADLFTII
jgi:hypothetical protein